MADTAMQADSDAQADAAMHAAAAHEHGERCEAGGGCAAARNPITLVPASGDADVDAAVYAAFRAAFPAFDVAQIAAETLRESLDKEDAQWRAVLGAATRTGKVSVDTLTQASPLVLQWDVEESALAEEHVVIVPFACALAIEVARCRELPTYVPYHGVQSDDPSRVQGYGTFATQEQGAASPDASSDASPRARLHSRLQRLRQARVQARGRGGRKQ